MDIQFMDPSDSPVPPQEVRVRRLQVDPYPDRQRFRVELELTPFQVRPDVALKLASKEGAEIASTSVIESIDHRIELTMHARRPLDPGEYMLRAHAIYDDQVMTEQEITFRLE